MPHGDRRAAGAARQAGDRWLTLRLDPDEAVLLARVAAGEAAAFRVLSERHAGLLIAVARRMLGNAADAEEVAQDALLRLWRQAGRWQEGVGVRPWLLRVAANLCIDRARRAAFWGEMPADAAETADPGPGPESSLEALRLRQRVAQALAALPARQRLAVTLFYDADMDGAAIGAVLGIGEAGVWSLLRRARQALAAALAQR